MSVASNRDFDDELRDFGADAVRAAIKGARWPGPPAPPLSVYDSSGSEEAEQRALKATPFVWRDTALIPPRRWLYGTHLLRKFLSVDVAAGGVGKSSLKIVEALAMVTGKPLLGKPVHEGPLRVWLYNLEDPAEETERRIHAAMIHYGIHPDELGGRLFTDSGRDQPVCIAEETPNGARIIRPVRDALREELMAREIDVFTLDPFVSFHSLNENDNRAVDLVSKDLSAMADECDCSIDLVHHVRKQNGAEATADSARGGSSLVSAARSVQVFNRMTKEEGERAGIPSEQIRFYFRTEIDKANLAPPEAAEWHRMNNVDLPNGDKVGVACAWEWPDPFAGISTAKLMEVQRAIADGEWRKDIRSRDKWAGVVIARVLSLDPEDDRDRKRVSQVLKEWVRNGVLSEVEVIDEHRKSRIHIEVGKWVTE